MSLPVWLLGTKFLLGGLCAWSHVLSKGSLSRGYLSRVVSVLGVSVQGFMSERLQVW